MESMPSSEPISESSAFNLETKSTDIDSSFYKLKQNTVNLLNQAENFNSHAAIVPTKRTDNFINWLNNFPSFNIKADICKLTSHAYDPVCDKRKALSLTSTLSFLDKFRALSQVEQGNRHHVKVKQEFGENTEKFKNALNRA